MAGLNDLEHNAFQLDEFESFLSELEAEGASRPRLTPVVRIPYEASQDYGHYVKQMLDVGAMGIILPQVKTPGRGHQARTNYAVSAAAWRWSTPSPRGGVDGVLAPLFGYGMSMDRSTQVRQTCGH